MKKTLVSLAIAGSTLLSQSVMAHSSIIESEMIEGKSTYLTVQVAHECNEENPMAMTGGIIIKMPNTQADVDNNWAFKSVSPVLSHVQEQRTKTTQVDMIMGGTSMSMGVISELAMMHLRLPAKWTFNAEFKGMAPSLPMDVASKELAFDIVQYCTDGTTNENTVSVTVIKSDEVSMPMAM